MNLDEFLHGMTELHAELVTLSETKGREYTRESDDQLANFKKHADELGLRPEQIWAVYFSKHVDAIISYCKTGQVKSEPIHGRIKDAILYLYLLDAIVTESEGEQQGEDGPTYEICGYIAPGYGDRSSLTCSKQTDHEGNHQSVDGAEWA